MAPIDACRGHAVPTILGAGRFMHIDHTTLPRLRDAGCERVVVADRQLGVSAFELSLEWLQPGAHTALRRGDGDRVVLVMSGFGKLLVDGAPQRFHAPCSLILPAGAECAVVNVGAVTLELVVALASSGG